MGFLGTLHFQTLSLTHALLRINRYSGIGSMLQTIAANNPQSISHELERTLLENNTANTASPYPLSIMRNLKNTVA